MNNLRAPLFEPINPFSDRILHGGFNAVQFILGHPLLPLHMVASPPPLACRRRWKLRRRVEPTRPSFVHYLYLHQTWPPAALHSRLLLLHPHPHPHPLPMEFITHLKLFFFFFILQSCRPQTFSCFINLILCHQILFYFILLFKVYTKIHEFSFYFQLNPT